MSKRWIKYTSLILSVILLAGCTGEIQKSESKVLKGEMEGTISISVMESSSVLEEWVKKFEEKYPKVKVKINFFSTPVITELPDGAVLAQNDPDPNKSFDKYVMTLNTAFMNGQGDDIIQTTGLPLTKYVESGYLENLKPYLNEANGFIPEEYRMNIIEATQMKEGIYTMPISYSFQLMSLNDRMLKKANMDTSPFEDNVWTLSKMTSLYKAFREKNKEKHYMTVSSGDSLFFNLLGNHVHNWIDVLNKKVSLDSKEFIDLLEECKALEEEGYIPSSKEKLTMDMFENSLFLMIDTYSPMIYNPDYYESEYKQTDYRVFTDEDKLVNINVYQNFGINAASPNKYVAFEFIKFLLSEEIQATPAVILPLNKKAFETQSKQIVGEMVKGMQEQGDQIKASEEDILQDYMKCINEWSEMKGQVNWIPFEVQQVVADEVRKFFKGEQSAEETAKNAQNKVYVMLNE